MKRLIIAIAVCVAWLGAAAQRGTVRSDTMYSETLGTDKPYSIYLPAGYDKSDARYPVLYLLHGADGDHTNWIKIARMKDVADLTISSQTVAPMIIVMPDASGQNGTNKNMGYFNQPGWEYEKYFYEELIPEIDSKYRTKADKKHRAIAGLSMGGGGAIAYGQRYPEYWGSACSLSGLVGKIAERFGKTDKDDYIRSVCDTDPTVYVAEADDATLDKLRSVRWYSDCGDDDFLYEGNVAFYLTMRHKGVPIQNRMRNGDHSWTYWSTGLPEILQFVSAGFTAPED